MENYKLGKIKISMPSGWHEVPYKTGLHILKNPDVTHLEVLSLLSGVDEDTIDNATDPQTIYYFSEAFQFIQSMPRNLEHPEMPRSMMLKGERVIFPFVLYSDKFDLGQSSVGQIEDMIAIIKNMSKEFIGEVEEGKEPRAITEIEQMEIIPFIIAIYLQKIVDGKYDHDKAIKMVDDVMNASFKDVINMGYFFFTRLIGLMNGSTKGYTKPNSIVKKLRRVYWILTQRLVSIRH